MLTRRHMTALWIWLALQVVLVALAVAAVLLPSFTRPILAALIALLAIEFVLYLIWRRKTHSPPPS